MSDLGNKAPDNLRAFIDRILRLKKDQDAIGDDIKEIYAEAKGLGFDKTAMGQVVAYLRKKDKNADKLAEQSALFDLYLSAYEQHEQPSHARAREGNQVPSVEHVSPPSTLEDGSADANTGGDHDVARAEDRLIEIEGARSAEAPVVIDELRATPADGESGVAARRDGPDFQPPAFLTKQKTIADFRPHCLHPEMCAGVGLKHCHACEKEAGLAEAAA